MSQSAALVGLCVKVAALNGRGRWWVMIDAVSDDGRAVRVNGGTGFGAPRWVDLAKVEGRTTRAERAIAEWIAARKADAAASLLFDENRANFRRIKTHEL
jgi:hypothetical protein